MRENQQGNLDLKLRDVWRRRQTLHLGAGALAFCRWGVLLFLAGIAIDWLVDLPAAGRMVFFVGMLAVAAYQAWRCGWCDARAFHPVHTALQVEEQVGGLESLLVTSVQLRGEAMTCTERQGVRASPARMRYSNPLKADRIEYSQTPSVIGSERWRGSPVPVRSASFARDGITPETRARMRTGSPSCTIMSPPINSSWVRVG